jgi:hypothetical protein
MKKTKKAAILLLLGTLVTIIGCNGDSTALVGKWEAIENGKPTGEITEFFSDGKAITNSPDLRQGTKFEWKTEKNRLIISAFGQTFAADYKIFGSTLIMKNDDGEVTRAKKIKN